MPKSKPLIILIDDEPAHHVLLKAVLPAREVMLKSFTSALAANDWLKEHAQEVALILLDIAMPDCNGDEFMSKFYSTYAYKPPVIVASSVGSVPTIVSVVKSGVVDYLLKPFEIDDLKEKIEKTLDIKLSI